MTRAPLFAPTAPIIPPPDFFGAPESLTFLPAAPFALLVRANVTPIFYDSLHFGASYLAYDNILRIWMTGREHISCADLRGGSGSTLPFSFGVSYDGASVRLLFAREIVAEQALTVTPSDEVSDLVFSKSVLTVAFWRQFVPLEGVPQWEA